jgi:hypothetical protein
MIGPRLIIKRSIGVGSWSSSSPSSSEPWSGQSPSSLRQSRLPTAGCRNNNATTRWTPTNGPPKMVDGANRWRGLCPMAAGLLWMVDWFLSWGSSDPSTPNDVQLGKAKNQARVMVVFDQPTPSSGPGKAAMPVMAR